MEKTTNWGDPVTCAELIERVGADEYTRLFKAHRRATVAATVNGDGRSMRLAYRI
jgi:hypothetical protein